MAGGQLDWREIPFDRLFPWVRLFGCVRNSIASKQLLLAALGLALHSTGTMLIASLFEGSWGFERLIRSLTNGVGGGSRLPATGSELAPYLSAIPARVLEPVVSMMWPFAQLFAPDGSWARFFAVMLASVWTVLVWTLIGGAISRIALARMTRSETVSFSEALRFAARKAATLVASPLCPLVGVCFLAIPVVLIGLLYWIPAAGSIAAGILLFIPLLAALVMAVILVGLALGWPLMPPAVAADEGDGFDALSRAYAYVSQRRAYYLFLILLAWLIGMAGLVFVDIVAGMVLQLTHWTLGLTAPREVLDRLFQNAPDEAPTAAMQIHRFWITVVAVLVHAWIYSYFWTAFSTIYLLLRQGVDGTPFHDLVWLHPKRGPVQSADAKPSAQRPADETVGSLTTPVDTDAAE